MDLFEPFCRFHQYFYEHQYKNREKNLKCHNRDKLFCYKTIYWAIFPKKKKPLCIFNPKVEKHTNTSLVCDLCWALTTHSRHVMNQVLSLMRLAKDSRVKFSVSQLHTHTHAYIQSLLRLTFEEPAAEFYKLLLNYKGRVRISYYRVHFGTQRWHQMMNVLFFYGEMTLLSDLKRIHLLLEVFPLNKIVMCVIVN